MSVAAPLNLHHYVTGWSYYPIDSDELNAYLKRIAAGDYPACFAGWRLQNKEVITIVGGVDSQMRRWPSYFTNARLEKDIPAWIEALKELGFEYPNFKWKLVEVDSANLLLLQFDTSVLQEATKVNHHFAQMYLNMLRFLWEKFLVRELYTRFTKVVKKAGMNHHPLMVFYIAEALTSYWARKKFPDQYGKSDATLWGHYPYVYAGDGHSLFFTSAKPDVERFAMFKEKSLYGAYLKLHSSKTNKDYSTQYTEIGQKLGSRENFSMSPIMSYKEMLNFVKQTFQELEKHNG